MNAAQSVFCHAHAAAKNGLYTFRVCVREALRDLLKAIGPSKDGPMVLSCDIHYYNIYKSRSRHHGKRYAGEAPDCIARRRT